MTFTERFATSLRNARTDKGITQKALAQRIGVTTSCVSQYETARRLPNLETVSNISHVLDVSLDDLIPDTSQDEHTARDVGQTNIYDLIGEKDVY